MITIIDFFENLSFYLKDLPDRRELIYLLFSSLAFLGLKIMFYRPCPFGYRDPLKLLRHTYDTYNQRRK